VPPADPQDAALNSVQAAGGTEPDAAAEPEIFGGVDETTLVDLAHTEFTGDGVKVGVIDDGLDFTHPVFGGCTAIGQGANCRVIAGHDFTDDDDITVSIHEHITAWYTFGCWGGACHQLPSSQIVFTVKLPTVV